MRNWPFKSRENMHNLNFTWNIKLSKMLLLLLAVFFLFNRTSDGKTAKVEEPPVHVYIDPIFAGKEVELSIAERYKVKDLTLALGENFKVLLKSQGISSSLSRSEDIDVPSDQRLVQAQKKRSKLYIVIQITRFDQDCMIFFIPKDVPFANDISGVEVDKLLKELEYQSKREYSLKIAGLMSAKVNNIKPPVCSSIMESANRLLKRSQSPIVMVDLSISKEKSSRLRDLSALNEVLVALSKAVAEYLINHESGSGHP